MAQKTAGQRRKGKVDKTPPSQTAIRPEKRRRHMPPRHRRIEDKAKQIIYVLDTNVFLHDATALFRFDEHDIYLTSQVLRELDKHKKGTSEIARNGRQVSRYINDLLVGHNKVTIKKGISLARPNELQNGRKKIGKLFFQDEEVRVNRGGLDAQEPDDRIILACLKLQEDNLDKVVVLVSKDINARIKAMVAGIDSEDYLNDAVIDDVDVLHTGMHDLPKSFWTKQSKALEADHKGQTVRYYNIQDKRLANVELNEFLCVKGEIDLIVRKKKSSQEADADMVVNYDHHPVWGVKPRNRGQNLALNLLMDPEVHFVSLLGGAGTGKTYLALAAGLAQVFDTEQYNEIFATRAPVPVGQDMGFLPGTEEEKMTPWMGAINDNLEALTDTRESDGGKGISSQISGDMTTSFVKNRIRIKSVMTMRGRTLRRRYIIIDEAQNLTPLQMKTLVTRAGPFTKIICLGNLKQIDTPYLTETSSGLAHVVDRFRGWYRSGHVTLEVIERSELAEHAEEVL